MFDKWIKWLFVSLIVLVFTACGGGSSGGDTPANNEPTKSIITGHAEDDPMPNATIKVTDENSNLVAEAISDENGKYTLEAIFEEGKTYTLESKGKLGDRNITLNSIFKFSADTVINANPLTELKYQLVQSGKTIDEAEALIRDYFSVVNGDKLERNRFNITDSIALGMIDLAKLYDGTLPIDAIEKIKEDILRNDGLDDNETKDYSYRTLLQNKISLEASTNSLKLGEEVSVTVVGLTQLNKNYMIKWRGIPEDTTDTNISKTFTITDNAQDVYVSATLYIVDGNRSKFISSADVTINFYKELVENNLTVTDSSIDNNFTVGESSITVSAGTVSDGSVIKVRELQTGSDSSIAQFEVDAGGATDGNITFNYKYDPYLVSEPRNLQISLRSGDEIKVLNVIEIDYSEHIVRFGIPLNGGISRSWAGRNKIIISSLKRQPTINDLNKFYKNYSTYILEVAKELEPNNYMKIYSRTSIFDDYGTEALIKAKLDKLLMTKENGYLGEYKFNILTASINNIIAWEAGNKALAGSSWEETFQTYLGCEDHGDPYNCFFLDNHTNKIFNTNKALATWVGDIKLDNNQLNLIKYGKVFTKLSVAFLQGDAYGFMTELGVATLSEMNMDPIITSGYNTAIMEYDLIINNTSNVDFLKGFGTGLAIDKAFDIWAESMKKDHAMKTAPIILPLSIFYEEAFQVLTRPYTGANKNFILSSKKDDLLNILYPEGERPYPIAYFNSVPEIFSQTTKSYLNNIYGFGKHDYNDNLIELFLKHNMPMEKKKLAYEMFKYSFGNREAIEYFTAIKDMSKLKIYTLLLEAYAIPYSEVSDPYTLKGFLGGDLKKKAIKIKSEYTLKKVILDLPSSRSLNKENNENRIYDASNVDSFEVLMQNAKLKLTDTQLSSVTIKKIKMETYGVGLEYSEDDNAWILDETNKEQHTYEVTENINDKFTYDSELEKNVLSFDTLFSGEDFTPFDDKLVGFKITLVYEKAGVEKVISKDFIFTTLSDTEHLVQTDFTGATLKSSAKDASTGSPIENAQVTLIPGGLTDFTDAEGNYEVSGVSAGNYTIIISKEGYRQVEAELTLVEDETKVYEASLAIDDEHATTLGGANITLKDALNGDIVTNGYVKVREGQNNKTGEVVHEVMNDGNSSLNISMYPNTYTVEVGANGYTHSFNTLTILGDVNGSYEFSITPALEADQVRAVLTWGEFPYDLDSHLVRKTDGNDDYHVYFGDQNPSNADANLDTDNTSGYGPETVTISNVNNASVYTYFVHNYSGGAGSVLPNSGAKLEVYFGDESRTFYVPNEDGQFWKVFEIVNGEIVPCTIGCVQGSEDSIVRSLDKDSYLFKNLPAK